MKFTYKTLEKALALWGAQYVEVGGGKPYAMPTIKAMIARGYEVKHLGKKCFAVYPKSNDVNI